MPHIHRITNKRVNKQIRSLCRLKTLHPGMRNRTKGSIFTNNSSNNQVFELIWKSCSDIVEEYNENHDRNMLYQNLKLRLKALHSDNRGKKLTLNELITQINTRLDMKIPLNKSASKSK